jgi:uncharacterized membrane protein YgdD (TMEM256/DUF423 family)
MDRLFVLIGSIIMFIGVGAGAFGAHGLSGYFALHPQLEGTYDTAVRYQLIHGLALFVVAWIAAAYGGWQPVWAGYLFVAGILLFSGSLYLLVFSQATWLGAITPLGGLAFLGGWLLLALAAFRAST